MNPVIADAIQKLFAELCGESADRVGYMKAKLDNRLSSVKAVHGEAIASDMKDVVADIASGRIAVHLVTVELPTA